MGKVSDDPNQVMAIIGLAKERLRAQGDTDLAGKLGITGDPARPNVVRTVSNWTRGKNAPQFTDLMNVLSRAGLLTEEADAAWRNPAQVLARLAAQGGEASASRASAAQRKRLRGA